MLKRTEGLVTLVVSNPSKKDATIQQKQKHYHLNNSTTLASNNTLFVNNKTNALTAPTQLSRPTTPVPGKWHFIGVFHFFFFFIKIVVCRISRSNNVPNNAW